MAREKIITTLTFAAHQDDDLLFMNPDIAFDVRAGHQVWVAYLTAGEVPPRNAAYAHARIEGVRHAYARMAQVPSNWSDESLRLGDRTLVANTLYGTNIRLVFTFLHAADGRSIDPESGQPDPDGDLKRMWFDDSFQATPIDGPSTPYTRKTYVQMLRDLIHVARPDYIRAQSSAGTDEAQDHVDHIYGAKLTAEADSPGGVTHVRRYEYYSYQILDMRSNVVEPWVAEKTAAWHAYLTHDSRLGPGSWADVMDRQYVRQVYEPGDPWPRDPLRRERSAAEAAQPTRSGPR